MYNTGIVQFRIQLLLEVEGDLTRRKRQAISNEDIIESVSCIVRESEIIYVMQYYAIASFLSIEYIRLLYLHLCILYYYNSCSCKQ